jgi:glycosyltransferase involved in cell wall biosynthesis
MHLTEQIRPTHEYFRSRGMRVCYIVYDLLPALRPDWWGGSTGEMFKGWIADISHVGTDLICISDAVAQELAQWIATHPSTRVEPALKIHSFHLGADVNSSLPSKGLPENASQVLEKIKSGVAFLMVSTIEPRKGYAQALEAFERLWFDEKNVLLVIVGKRGWLVDKLIKKLENHPELGKKLFWLEGISDEYLELLYQAVDCVASASEGEGFGLPLIEAAQHGKPLFVRRIPVFEEVAKNHAYYFSGTSANELAESLAEWLILYEKNEHPSSLEMPWLTWKQSADQLIEKLLPAKNL